MPVSKIWRNGKILEVETIETPQPIDAERVINQLWTACNNYERDRISSNMFTVCLLNKNTSEKCESVINWVNSLWSIYYAKKAQITEFTAPDLDFSAGELPYKWPEISSELGL
jgi:hypothetical protein